MDAPTFADGVRLAAVAVLCGAGCLVMIAGAASVLRLPDFYTRIHAFTAMHVAGAPLLLAGFAIAAWDWRILLKLMLLGALIAVLAPAIAHIAGAAAHGAGLTPHHEKRGEAP